MMSSARIGFLHTAAANIATFDAVTEGATGRTGTARATTTHLVDESLLADARRDDLTDPEQANLDRRILAGLQRAAGDVDVVVCTCSTIAGRAERLATQLDPATPFVRIDRPMAELAVTLGNSIAVIAAVESTMGPTCDLLEEVATAVDRQVELIPTLCQDAWPHFEEGDLEAYLSTVAAAVERAAAAAAGADVIVLAQASMAPAVNRCAVDTPVLASPELAVAAALDLAISR